MEYLLARITRAGWPLAVSCMALAGQAAAQQQQLPLPVLAGTSAQLQLGALPGSLTPLDPLGPTLNAPRQRFLSSAQFERKMGAAVGTVSIGVLREVASAAGAQQSPAMAMYHRPSTSFTAATLGYALTSRSAVTAMVSLARTEGLGAPDSLLAQVSSVRTLAYSLAWSRRQVWAPHDSVALTLSVPARVRSGTLPSSGNISLTAEPGALPFGTALLNLRPTATERDLEWRYTVQAGASGERGKFSAALMWRVHPGHVADARPDYLLGLRYTRGF